MGDVNVFVIRVPPSLPSEAAASSWFINVVSKTVKLSLHRARLFLDVALHGVRGLLKAGKGLLEFLVGQAIVADQVRYLRVYNLPISWEALVNDGP